MTLAVRLLALIALMLMPFGMATAPAEPASDHHPAAAMAMDHCPGEQSDNDRTGAVGDCAMPCSAALPASDLAAVDADDVGCVRIEPAFQLALAGIELEIATPPPKLS